jgi:hypothetical protein
MLKEFKTIRENKEIAVLKLGQDGDFVSIKSIRNKAFQTAKSKIQTQYEYEMRNGLMSEEEMSSKMGVLIARHIVQDWQLTEKSEDFDEAKKVIPGLKSCKPKGTPEGCVRISSDQENRERLLASPDYADFVDFIVEKARVKANFSDELDLADEGN